MKNIHVKNKFNEFDFIDAGMIIYFIEKTWGKNTYGEKLS